MNRDEYIQAIQSVQAGERFKVKAKLAMAKRARPRASRGLFVTVACAAASFLIVCGMIVLYQFAPEDVWGRLFPTRSEQPVPSETAAPSEPPKPTWTPPSEIEKYLRFRDGVILYGRLINFWEDENGIGGIQKSIGFDSEEALFSDWPDWKENRAGFAYVDDTDGFVVGEKYVFFTSRYSGSLVHAAHVTRGGQVTPMYGTPVLTVETDMEALREYLRHTCEDLGIANKAEGLEFAPIYTADLLHNGTVQTIELEKTATYHSMVLRVTDTDGYVLWQDDPGTWHGNGKSLFLTRHEGRDYLLRYEPYSSTGAASYRYKVFSLNERGEEIELESGEVHFMDPYYYRNVLDGEPFPRAEIKAFMERAIYWIGRSELLVTSDTHAIMTMFGYAGGPSPQYITGSAEQPITGLKEYFFESPELTLDEQLDLYISPLP